MALKCEGLTIRNLRERINILEGTPETEETPIDEMVTKYLNSKPGTWSLVSATSNQFGWYFIWSDGE